ncbi:MAG TPA: hypothetical protein VMW87_05765 [Spirochaetia bacterium]|nr:hypothetical protein [Spirochaetia bacterium]
MAARVSHDEDMRGVRDPDFLALGLGGTSMMSMLWAVAMGRRAVGIEMRGDPFLGVHWNVRADLYHQLGLIDRLMIERYGEDRIPRRGDGDKIFRLAETFYSSETIAGDIVADEVIDGFDAERHISGTIHHVEFIDDRWRDGVPNRAVILLTPPKPDERPDEKLIRTDMTDVLDGPSTFQGGASTILVLLRRYLEKMEEMDLDGDYEPRVRLFTRHRVVNTPEGFDRKEDGRIGFRVEALQELDYKGKFVRVRRPGSQIMEIGVPELFMIAQGAHSTDAERLGFKQEDVAVDQKDGRGPVVAQADYLAGLIEAYVGGRLRRRISTELDEDGQEYWVRQIAVGHEEDPEVGWCLVQVPDFKTFDPIKEGLVPEGTDMQSPEFFAAYDTLLYDFYAQQVGDVLEMTKDEVKKIQTVYGPKLFTLIERVGADALLAANGVVAGDAFGNGHFLTSGGAMTGMIGHSWRVYEYYLAREAGVPHVEAIRTLADKIKEDTHSWLHVSAKEYSEAIPINFGAERISQIEAQGGIASSTRAASIDATRRQRHSLAPLNPSDWRRLFLRNGKVYSVPLPELHAMHPALRGQQTRKKRARIIAAFVAPDLTPASLRFIQGAISQPGTTMGLIAPGSLDELPQNIQDRLGTFVSALDATDSDKIVEYVGKVKEELGEPERLLGTAAALQVPLAVAREKLGIEGLSAESAHNFRDASRLRERLAEAGVPIPRYARVESVQDGLAFGTEIGYYPLVVKPNEGAWAGNTHRVDTEQELSELLNRLHPTEEQPLICEEFIEGRECTLEVISVGGVPAWFSATRFGAEFLVALRNPRTAFTMTLPREQDDPADPLVRRMGFAALKALGMDTGVSSMRWFRRLDGTAVVTDVIPSPPVEPIGSLMTLAHGTDIYRVWGNTIINGLFAPIPRLYAAGAAMFRTEGEGTTVSAVHGLAEIVEELGELVVRVEEPRVGQLWTDPLTSGCFVLLRHAETAVIDEALRRIADSVWVELSPAAVGER